MGFRWSRVTAAAGATVMLGAAGLTAQTRAPTVFRHVGALVPAGIRESSGIAVSRRHPGVLWTHNDSGDLARLYAVDSTGALLATYQVLGATNVDWEDIALGPCPNASRASCLYVGDIGDNGERRRYVTIYALPEPDPRTRGAAPVDTTAPVETLRIRYADGAHDAEALTVAPDDGTISIVTKGRRGPILRYRLRLAAFAHDSVVAAPLDTLPIVPQVMLARVVTGAAISPSGRRVVVRTYAELFFFKRVGVGAAWVPDGTACWLGMREKQGEAVDFLDEDTLILTSEAGPGGDGSISVVRCP